MIHTELIKNRFNSLEEYEKFAAEWTEVCCMVNQNSRNMGNRERFKKIVEIREGKVQSMSRLTRKETIIIRGNETAACNYKNNECNDSCRYGICKWQEKANMRLKKYEDTGLTPEQVQQLAERDTAKKPIIIGVNGAIGCRVGECPKCGGILRSYMRFCDECGQRLDWSEQI